MPKGVYKKSAAHGKHLSEALKSFYSTKKGIIVKQLLIDNSLAFYKTKKGIKARKHISAKLTGIKRSAATKAKISASAHHNSIKDFWKLVNKQSNKECWHFLGSLTKEGYGQFKLWGIDETLVHRIVWTLFFGVIPNKKRILHKCDNYACCNPYHLFLGSQKQNMEDCRNKGRAANQILNWRKVTIIRSLRRQGMSLKYISKLFGIAKTTVSNITNFHKWPPEEDPNRIHLKVA